MRKIDMVNTILGRLIAVVENKATKIENLLERIYDFWSILLI